MKTIRVYFNYKHVDEPWGGANNFIRALHNAMSRAGGFEFAESIEDSYDVLFLNQLSMGPASGSRISPLSRIRQARGDPSAGKRILVRAINLRRHSHGPTLRSWLRDISRNKLLNMADMVIFQSHYQKSFFTKYGYKGKHDAVIHNGADAAIFHDSGSAVWDGKETLRMVSSSMSLHSIKRQDLIAKVSECEGVEVSHMGNWPDSVDSRKVKLLGVLGQKEGAAVLRRSHVLLHPAVKDVCPNVVFEAICCGLPVIYNDGAGSGAEIVAENGLPINEGSVEQIVGRLKDRYRQLKEHVRQTQRYYSIDRAVAQYIEVFSGLVNR
ncbi:MAG: glycosyltransferase family 4 protein [Phycisphaerales bacterium]|nr:MAG: glycosyltransferase family 4 protein [Phycisphaerales bacterium]